MNVAYISTDLFFESRVAGAARQAGANFKTFASDEAFLATASDQTWDLCIIDLSADVNLPNLIAQTKRWNDQQDATVPTLAFGSHVHRGRLAAAESAGCDRVWSRGQFDQQMDSLFSS